MDTWEDYKYTNGGPNGVDYWREETAYYKGRYRRYYTDIRQERKEGDKYKRRYK